MRRRRLRILTFTHHDPFLYELAKTGHDFDLLAHPRAMWPPEWDPRSRPLPPNVRPVGSSEDIASLDLRSYDLVLAQTLEQFQLVEFAPLPKLLVLHGGLAPEPSREDFLDFLNVRRRLRDVPVVYVSEYCSREWGVQGRVVYNGVDVRDYADFPWQGEDAAALTVSHFFRERRTSTGYDVFDRVVGTDIPATVVGYSRDGDGAGPAESWTALRGALQSHRVYLNTTPFGAGQAVLEAAAAGMPIVTTPRVDRVRLFTHGQDAFISSDPRELRDGVLRLLADHDLARTMGARARATVERARPIEPFLESWDDALRRAARSRDSIVRAHVPRARRLRAEIAPEATRLRLRPGERTRLPVRVRNVGSTRWRSYTRHHAGEVRLTYRVRDLDRDAPEEEGLRTPLPEDVRPGAELVLNAFVEAPAVPGRYSLRWDLVAERVTWFVPPGDATAEVSLVVD